MTKPETPPFRDYDDAFARERYRHLMQVRPELFRNPPGAAYEIVTDEASQSAAQSGQIERWKERSEPSVPDNRVGILAEDNYVGMFIRDAVRFRDGKLGLYSRFLVRHGVAILPVMNGQVLLIRCFRHAMRDWIWELPRGSLTTPKTPENDAIIELREEIGAEARELIPLGIYHTTTGFCDERIHLYLAHIDRHGAPQLEEGVDEIRAFGVGELEQMVGDGTLTDSSLIAALYRARLRGLV